MAGHLIGVGGCSHAAGADVAEVVIAADDEEADCPGVEVVVCAS